MKYYLVDNPMSKEPGDYRAQVTNCEAVTEDEIFDYIIRKGSGIAIAEVMANYQEIIEAHEYFLKQGYGINTTFINARPTIRGVFKDKNDSFDPSRHQVKFKLRLGKYYDQTTLDVKIEKVEQESNIPVLNELEDITSGTVNEILTPDGVAVLKGLRLKFAQEDPNQGISLSAADSSTIRVSKVVTQRSSQIVFIVLADLTTGEYTLEVRILPKGNKEVKKGGWKKSLPFNSYFPTCSHSSGL